MKGFSDRFSQCALCATVGDAAIAFLAGLILMVAFRSEPALALKVGAGVALAYCLRLIYRLAKLQEKGICHTEIWQFIPPDELPHGASAIRQAQERMEYILLRFAKAASAVATVLFGAAFLITLN